MFIYNVTVSKHHNKYNYIIFYNLLYTCTEADDSTASILCLPTESSILETGLSFDITIHAPVSRYSCNVPDM